VNKTGSVLFFGAIAGAPLPFGSTEPRVIAFWCVVLGCALVLASPRSLDPRHIPLFALAAVVVAAYGLVLHEQLATEPWLALASPHPIWARASELLRQPLQPSVSIARNQPLFLLGAPLAAMLSLLCGFLVGADRDRARRLLRVIAWSGAAYAAYGIVAHLVHPYRILWREKEAYISDVTATFINHNTAAAYFGSCAVVWLLILCERSRHHLPPGPLEWRRVPGRLFENTPPGVVVAFAMLFLCLAALFMTVSRAGVVLSLLALVVALALYLRRDLPQRIAMAIVLVGSGALALVTLQILGGGVSARFNVEGIALGGRLETYRSTLRMIADHPWFGTGLGTFVWAYPAYRSDALSIWGTWDLAHSTPLELAAEMGLPLAILVMAGWGVIFAVLIHGVRTRRRDVIIPLAALCVALLTCLHSLVDFSLQVSGLAIVVFGLVGAGLAQSFSSRPKPRNKLDST
jgi:O-antigen ligase